MSQLDVERRGRVALVTISNPPRGYMDRDTIPDLETALANLESDDSVGAIVLTGGVPGVFVRHYSVHELEALSEQLRASGLQVDTSNTIPERNIDQTFRRIENMPKPVIAALNGTAMGGGFELSLACDIRIAEDGDFWFGLPEINVGILPGAGGTQKLARLVGTARALEMTLRGRTVRPAEALELGIIAELTSPGGAGERALAIAGEIASKPPLAVAHIKRLVRSATATALPEGLALERTLFLDLLVSDDAHRLMHRMNEGSQDIRNP
jgi:enoyl-CoA hydratase